MTQKHFFIYWSPVVLWMGVIFWMSSEAFSADETSSVLVPILNLLMPWITPEGIEIVHNVIRKFGHISEYFVLGLLLFRAFCGTRANPEVYKCMLYSLIVLVIYALSDEFHQSFVQTRTASLADVGLDTIGGILSQTMISVSHSLKRQSICKKTE